MSFRDNLQHLRATRNMTQEQLAMLLGVSRQSVSKWEAEKAYPEMDKLIKICNIFDCTLDELVKGDLTERVPEPELSVAVDATPTDVCGYDEVMLRTAHRIALGVAALLFGIGFAGFFDEEAQILNHTIPGGFGAALCFFGGIAIGLALIIPAAFERGAFQKAHPFIEDFYTSEQKIEAHTRMGHQIALGVGCIMLGLICAFALQNNDGMAAVAFFFPLAIGVHRIVDGALVASRTNVEEYNDDALSELSDAEIEALDDPALRERARSKKREGGIYGAIILTATAIALALLFIWEVDWFWTPWMLGGICCGIVACVRQAR